MHNIDKILHYIKFFAKSPIEIDGRIEERKKTGIRLAPTFFNSDDCIQCGRCCIGEDHVYTEHEYKWIMECPKSEFEKEGLPYFRLLELRENTFPEKHTINGKEINVYVHKCPKTEMFIPAKGRVKETCNWMFEQNGLYRCGIHPVSSMTCDLPHTRMFHAREGSVSIGTAQYGRNWAMGCPITFHAPKDEEEFTYIKNRRMAKLQSIADCASDMNILDTYIPEILDYIKPIPFNNYESALGHDFITIGEGKKQQIEHIVPRRTTFKFGQIEDK